MYDEEKKQIVEPIADASGIEILDNEALASLLSRYHRKIHSKIKMATLNFLMRSIWYFFFQNEYTIAKGAEIYEKDR